MAKARWIRATAPLIVAWAVVAWTPTVLAEAGELGPGSVQVGRVQVLAITSPAGADSPEQRAARASESLRFALLDPDCDPSRWSLHAEGDRRTLWVCDYRVVSLTPADAASAGVADTDTLAALWTERLQAALREEKQAAFSARLLRRAILGFLLPVAFLGVLAFVRWLSRLLQERAQARLDAGLSLGPLKLLATSVERAVVVQLIVALRWLAYLGASYAFVVILLQMFPRSQRWGVQLLEPLIEVSVQLGEGLGRLLTRLPAILLILVALRVLLQVTRRLFKQVRAGRLRVEPFLSPENAGPAEATARAVLFGICLVLLGLLVPGEFGYLLLAVAGLAALTLTVGMWEMAANAVAGTIILYARPFRRGHRVRVGNLRGEVTSKGLLHFTLETSGGSVVLVPNRWLFGRPFEILELERRLSLRLTLLAEGGPSAGAGLLRHAAVESGLKRDEGTVELVAIGDGRLVFELDWPIARGTDVGALRQAYLEALLSRCPGMGCQLLSAERLSGRA